MKYKILGYFGIFGAVLYFAHTSKLGFTFDTLSSYLEILLSVSSMIFTIMGIWIAFLYPNALMKLVSPSKIANADFSETLTETRRLESLVGTVLMSALVVTAIVLIYLCRLLFGELDLTLRFIAEIKSITISSVVVLTFIQLEAIASVVHSNIMFLNDLHNKREDREMDQQN